MSYHDIENKFDTAIANLKPNTEYVIINKAPETEEEFNSNIKWVIGKTENNKAILTLTNPHSELTWVKISEEISKL
jgi:hypothetical protein